MRLDEGVAMQGEQGWGAAHFVNAFGEHPDVLPHVDCARSRTEGG
jgi:hypothetical protein